MPTENWQENYILTLTPDDKGAHKKFQQVNEANEVLSDPEKRKKYDKYGAEWKHGEEYEKARQQQQYSRQEGAQDFGGGQTFGGDDFSDFFASMFGQQKGGGRRQSQYRGRDYNAELHLQLNEAYTTHKKH